jgi:hypothetical protein
MIAAGHTRLYFFLERQDRMGTTKLLLKVSRIDNPW